MKFQENNDIGCMYKQWFKNKVKHKQRAHYISVDLRINRYHFYTAGNRHKQNSWFCKEIREDNFRFWWRRVHEDASQGMYMSKIEISFFTA